MFRPSALLRSFCHLLANEFRADTASIYLDDPESNGSESRNGLLIHGGSTAAVPELASEASARELARESANESGLNLSESSSPIGRLVRISVDHTGTARSHAQAAPVRRFSDRNGNGAGSSFWVGLRFADARTASDRFSIARSSLEEQQLRLVQFAAELARHSHHVAGLLQDTLTELPGRLGLRATLVALLASARRRRRPISLILLCPAELNQVNAQSGHDAGDALLRATADCLRSTLREMDPVHRYGAGIFAVVLSETTKSDALIVATKLRKGLAEVTVPGMDADRPRFALGVAEARPHEDEAPEGAAIELLRRADQALAAAQQTGDDSVVLWEPGTQPSVTRDRLRGIFTADPAKDYRNMLLLWELVALIGSREGPEALANQIVDRLRAAFSPSQLAIIVWLASGEPRTFLGAGAEPDRLVLEPERRDLVRATKSANGARTLRGSVPGEAADTVPRECYAVPLVHSGRPVGCIFLEFDEETRLPDDTDVAFLESVASELAAALDRMGSAHRERTRLSREREELKSELDELQLAVQQANFVYRSPVMEDLLERARRAAPTDATILVTGESGTGKEILARTVHQLSSRRGRPLVLVDCGAIAASLIDSELFGHQKGAYTGAEDSTPGRLAEGEGGTVVLDEIGELPLPVQSKLLRFVETKQITPVGTATPREVDVRIIALTHRNLAAEVEAGTFRADLYYRLRVVHLEVPSLDERPMDVPVLASHFLRRYAGQYQKPVAGISIEATEALRAHRWPGNVRELENRILQAVILCEGTTLEAKDLGITPEASRSPGAPTAETVQEPVHHGGPSGAGAQEHWTRLATLLSHELRHAAAEGPRAAPPLGRWLAEDLLLVADSASASVSRRGAGLLGLAETTYRRRLSKLMGGPDPAGSVRSPTWDRLRAVLSDLVHTEPDRSRDLVRRAQDVLLSELLARWPDDVRLGSALLGVSQPTFRTRMAVLAMPRRTAFE